MILCLVTERRRFSDSGRGLLEQVRRAADAGVDLIQVRERDLEAAELVDLVGRIMNVTRGSPTRVVVNDRVDVALAADADGVHLRHDSIAVPAARELARAGWLIGRSVHNTEELDEAIGADYVIAGTVSETGSKPSGVSLLGLEGLRAVASASPAPVLAIGGITLERMRNVAATGAAGMAGISLFVLDGLKDVVADARRRFDSVKSAS